MTTAEAKYAVWNGCTIVYKDTQYRADAVISRCDEHKWEAKHWYNVLRLIPLSGARSVTEARMIDCRLLEPITVSETE